MLNLHVAAHDHPPFSPLVLSHTLHCQQKIKKPKNQNQKPKPARVIAVKLKRPARCSQGCFHSAIKSHIGMYKVCTSIPVYVYLHSSCLVHYSCLDKKKKKKTARVNGVKFNVYLVPRCRQGCFPLLLKKHTGIYVRYICRPCTTVRITPLWGRFPSSIARQPTGSKHRTIPLRTALGEIFPTLTLLAPALIQLWRSRARKIGPGCV